MVSVIKELKKISAQAKMHHALLLGLQLMITTNKSPDIVGDWIFRLFRRQHHDKFLSSLDKLGLAGLPDAVACAQYHVVSNSIGGVPVEYMYESDRKAWVRFRYPRWIFHGPTICGVPQSISQGFLKGWYAQNGISLNNPRLGFVCVSEDMTGEFGLCGYFNEYEHELTNEERLQFAKGELPPLYKSIQQPKLPSAEWDDLRLQKAKRNYAMDYIRNGLCELANVIGSDEALELASRATKLIGLQYANKTREMLGLGDGDLFSAVKYLQCMFEGLGDEVEILQSADSCVLRQRNLRIVQDFSGAEREFLLNVWVQLWHGALASYRQMKVADLSIQENEIVWRIRNRD